MFGKKKDVPKKSEQDDSSSIASRKRLYKSLSQSEKSMRRSTIGPSSTPQNTLNTKSAEIESSPFLKVVRDGQQQPDNDSKKKIVLTTEEKKSRRKSLLAPMQNLFNVTTFKEKKDTKTLRSLDSLGIGDSAKLDSKKKKKISKKEKKDHVISKETENDAEMRLKKERKKKLQKELDKIDKAKEKKEKTYQNNLFISLNQALQMGDNDVRLPTPIMKVCTMQPIRPPPVFKSI